MNLPAQYEHEGMVVPAVLHGQGVTIPELPSTDYAGAARFGMWVLGIGFGGFLLWATLAPLDEGVPAPGIVSVESSRKRIDHPAGGIVERILIKEGEKVRQGQELVILNETQARAALNAVAGQWRSAAAQEARLRAERDGLSEVRFPQELEDMADEPEVAKIMRAQSDLFTSRRNSLRGEIEIINDSVRGLENQLSSLAQLRGGHAKQLELFNEQLESYQKLNTEGFIGRTQLLDVERQLVDIQSKHSEDLANIAAVSARLAEFRTRAAQLQIEYKRSVEDELTTVQKDLATLNERLVAQADMHARLVVRAPVSGTVVSLAVHTIGGTVMPGEPIMDIVPENDDLIVQARVAPQYIDRVHAGLPADVHFDAYMRDIVPPVIKGKVEVVSADALSDEKNSTMYYSIRVTVPAAETTKLGGLQLQPGMQGTVMIKTGERSLLVYLLRPLVRRFAGALSER